MRTLVILSLREMIRLTGAVVIIKVEVMVEEITALKVEALEIMFENAKGGGHPFNFCKVKEKRSPVTV